MHISRTGDPSALPRGADGVVVFTFHAPAGTRSVALAGTFNSWVGDACMLEQAAPGLWRCSVPLAPGRHLYKYVVDGSAWIPDPANPWISEDGQNNSCVTVDTSGDVFIRRRGIGPAEPGIVYQRHQALPSPAWLHDAVIYQLSVRAFGGTFNGVRERLGYLAELGVNTIWMMPIHPIGEQARRGTLGDPYAVRDFDAIDPALGDGAALRALVDAIHARGMRIIFDWTLNRSSADHPFTRSHPHWYTRDAGGTPNYLVPNREYFAGFDFRERGLRDYLVNAMRRWVGEFDLDGLRFDDSDITPTDFLDEIRAALAQVRPDIALISQAYDEMHHLAACDLSYEGGTREVLRQIVAGEADADAVARYWEESTFSFPRGALRLRWLEDKEQPRADAVFGRAAHLAAASVLLAMDGVPHILMGQEFGDAGWRDWTVLFDGWTLDWSAYDPDVFKHYQALIGLRRALPALRHGDTAFIGGLPPGVVGMRRGAGSDAIEVYANLSPRPVPLAPGTSRLYARGWDGAGTLAGYGCWIGRVDGHGGT